MIFVLFYLLLAIIILFFITIKNGDLYITFLICLSFTLCGTLNEKVYNFFFLSPHEWIILITFALLVLHGMAFKRSYLISYTWLDKFYLLYFIAALIAPFFSNLKSLDDTRSVVLPFFLPIKIWMVFRIFYYLLCEKQISKGHLNINSIFENFLKILVIVSLISAFFGIFRYVELPVISDFVNDTWPVYYYDMRVKTVHGRLTGTMSGENGTGLFFAFNVLFSLYLFVRHQKYKYIITFIIFYFFTILSGSVASNITLLLALFIFLKKFFQFKHSIRLILAFFMLTIIIYGALFTNTFHTPMIKMAKDRYYRNFSQEEGTGVMPTFGGFKGRYRNWTRYSEYFYDKPFLGYGFEGAGGKQRHIVTKGGIVAESFYVYLLIYSGFIGLIGYLLLKYKLIKKLVVIKRYCEQSYLIRLFLFMILFSQISQLSFQYGGTSELFGGISAFTLFFVKADREELTHNEYYMLNNKNLRAFQRI